MQKIICLLACIVAVLFSEAQDVPGIRIRIIDPQQHPLAAATVELRNERDSSLVKVQASDADGVASFAAPEANRYFYRVSHTGFAEATTPAFAFSGGLLVLPPVQLQPAGNQMTGIVVTARKPFVELKPGKTVVNVDAGITMAGTTAMEALEKMPGITVDKDGNISLKGKSGVTVMLDGKPTYLDAAQLSTLLNGMSASQIAQVEIMDQPPAGYDAAGNAGVINIKIKKNQQRGFNGAFSTSYAQGFYPKTNNNLQLNYHNGKWNLFASYSVNINTSYSRIYALRKYYKTDGTLASVLEQPSGFKGNGNTHNLRAGADYALNGKTSFGLTLTGLALGRNNDNTNPAIWMNATGETDSLILTQGNNRNSWKNAGANFNFKHAFTASRELSADVDVIGYRMRGRQYFENRLTFPGSYTEATRAELPSDIHIVSAKADYAEQQENLRLMSGVKSSHITTDNLASYEVLENSQWLPDYGKTNHFLYTEDIHALYASAETKLQRWSVQGGLRFEATSYKAKQLGNPLQKDSSFSRSYNSLFPSLQTSFDADSSNSFSFNAGRRIDRPAFQKLNPFLFIINKYTYQKGNPFYRPQYTWNLELSHVYKNKLITSFGYSLTTDYFSQIFPLDSSGLVIYTEGNLGKLQQYTLSVAVQLTPTRWWSVSAQGVAVHKEMEGVIGKKLHSSINQFELNMNNGFRLQNDWSAELSGFYTSRSQNDIQEFVDPAGQLSAGIARAVLKNKGTLKLSVRDLFHTQWMKGNTFFPQATEYFKISRDTRLVQLSFSYRFGKNFKTSKRSDGAAGEEIRRVGNG